MLTSKLLILAFALFMGSTAPSVDGAHLYAGRELTSRAEVTAWAELSSRAEVTARGELTMRGELSTRGAPAVPTPAYHVRDLSSRGELSSRAVTARDLRTRGSPQAAGTPALRARELTSRGELSSRGAPMAAATPLVAEARSEDEDVRAEAMPITLPRFDVGHGDGSENVEKRDNLDANAALFAPTARVRVGNREHVMLIVPSYPQTVFTPEARYAGGRPTKYKDTVKQQDGSVVTDTIFLDSVTLGGATANNVAVGSSSAPVPSLNGASIAQFGADGVVGFTADSNPAGYSTRVNKVLKGFAGSLPSGRQVMTVRLAPGLSSGGSVTIGRKPAGFKIRTAYSDQWAAAGVKLNGMAIPTATVDTGSPFVYAPLKVAEQFFQQANLKTRTVPWRGSTVLEAEVDCARGFPMEISFGGGVVKVPGTSGVFKDSKTGRCTAALRGSPEGESILGWPLFRAASVSYDAETLEIGVEA